MAVHPSHQPEASRAFREVGLLLLAMLLVLGLPDAMQRADVAQYLPLHMALETLAIMVAGLIFGVVWSVRNERLPRNFVWLGAAFLGVGLLDFSHMLSTHGMPGFITPSSPDKAIYFWLAARTLSALALLVVAWMPWTAGGDRRSSQWVLLGVLLLVAAVHALYFLQLVQLPRFYVPGLGLTRVKLGWEYALVAAYLLTAARLLWALRQPRSFNASGLFAAACAMAMSEYFFTVYTSVSDSDMLAGHVYKVVACLFLYRAMFVETVRRPYRLLRESKQRLRATLDALPDLLFELDGDGRYLDVHTSSPEGLLAPAEQLLGRRVHDVMPMAARDTVMAALAEAARDGISRGKLIELNVIGGDHRWFELSVACKLEEGAPPRYVVISRDVSQRRRTEAELRRLSAAVEQSPLSIVIVDLDDHIEFVNPAFTRNLGYAAAEVLGRRARDVMQSGATPEAVFRELRACMSRGEAWQGEFVNRCKSGREIIEAVLIYPLRDEHGEVTHYLAHHEDVTEKKRAAERIQQLSHYDQLTGLPNRAMLQEHFRYACAQGSTLALLWIDLDRFKEVNDTLGHQVGDVLLQEMSRRLLSTLDAADLPSRHSGDEFVAILPATGQAAAAAMAQKLLQAMSQPLELAGQELFTTVSVGIALYPADADQLDGLLQNAEVAMYRAKEEGRNDYRFFAAEMQEHASRALALSGALKQALPRNELRVYYQPQVALADGRIVGAEALLRWESPQWGAVSPGEFIPLAEANGLIVPIGEWVLRTTLEQLRTWLDAGLPAMTMAVNLSAVQFNQLDLAERIGAVLAQTGAPPECLELELTEAVAMKAPLVVAQRIEELGQLRIRIAVDDFGTGYSSLSYLKQFKIGKIKIDQSFVRDIRDDPDDQAIVAAIIQMADGLGMGTIAEGVETVEQLNFLRERGCEEAQGYLFSRPLPPAEFEQFVRARMPRECRQVSSSGAR